MKNRTVIGLLAPFLLGAIVGCSSPFGDAPPHVRAVLDSFIRSGYACSAGGSDRSAFRQWQCDGTTGEGTHYTVILDADARHLKNVVATIDQSQTGTTNRDTAIRFFGEIADLGIGGPDPSIKSWIATHLGDGAQEWTGSVFVTLDELKPVTHLVLFDPA